MRWFIPKKHNTIKERTLVMNAEQITNSLPPELLAQLEELNPEPRYNLWGSMSNIQSELLPPPTIKKQKTE